MENVDKKLAGDLLGLGSALEGDRVRRSVSSKPQGLQPVVLCLGARGFHRTSWYSVCLENTAGGNK